MSSDTTRDQAIEISNAAWKEAALNAKPAGRVLSAEEITTISIDALADAGLLRGGGDTDEATAPFENLGWRIVARRAEAEAEKLRAELVDANLDREHADEARKRAFEISDAQHAAHRKTLERTRRVVKERDRAVADLAALRARVEKLADGWLSVRVPDFITMTYRQAASRVHDALDGDSDA